MCVCVESDFAVSVLRVILLPHSSWAPLCGVMVLVCLVCVVAGLCVGVGIGVVWCVVWVLVLVLVLVLALALALALVGLCHILVLTLNHNTLFAGIPDGNCG